jgi:hypothetical protein
LPCFILSLFVLNYVYRVRKIYRDRFKHHFYLSCSTRMPFGKWWRTESKEMGTLLKRAPFYITNSIIGVGGREYL